MTIIELNIAGLQITRLAPSRRAMKRSWRRNCRTLRQNWPVAQLRARQESDQSAA